MDDRGVSPWWYISSGCLIGVALGLLMAPAFGYRRPDDLEPPASIGLKKRLMRRIPRRIKVAGAVGAVKGAGGRAYRDLRESLWSGD